LHPLVILWGRGAGLSRHSPFAGLFSSAINLLLLTVSLYMLQVYDRVLTSRSLRRCST
jgi:ABC-type protease/lipase transport system fused ATPase/permease subunit